METLKRFLDKKYFMQRGLWYFWKYIGIIRKFSKYLNDDCVLGFDQHFSLKYFLKNDFVKGISPK